MTMKKTLPIGMMICFLLGSLGFVFAQDPSEPVEENGDTLVIQPTFNGNPLNALNEWILWDHNGDLNTPQKHTVYKLKQNERYPITTTIKINGRLSLVADKPDLNNKPPQIGVATDLEGNSPGVMYEGGPFTFRNIWWSELNYSTMTNNAWGLMGKLTVDSTSTYIDGCYYEHVRAIALKATSGKENRIYITNCFHNDCGRGAGAVWQGHFFNGGETLTQDSVVYRNNTFINTPGNFFNNRKNMTRYIEITHNTLINTTANPWFTTFWIEGHIKNNLLLNVYSWGEDEAYRIAQEPDALPYSIINIDTLANEWPMNDTTWYERESDRVLELANNYYGWRDDIEAFWASVDSINAPMWMNSRTLAMFADDVNYPGLTEENTFTKADLGLPTFVTPIQGTDDMLAYVKDVLWGGQPGFRWVWEPEGATIPNADIDWPPLEDLRLTSSAFLGDDGKPLGDLNWYKKYAVRWDMTDWGREADGDITAIENPGTALSGLSLEQNYPNPFTSETIIRFNVLSTENMKLSVYDNLGRNIKTLINGKGITGMQSIIWDGTNSAGHSVSGGIYFLRLETGSQSITKKMFKLK